MNTNVGDLLMRILSLPPAPMYDCSPELLNLNKILKDMNVDVLPERAISYEQVNFGLPDSGNQCDQKKITKCL